LKIICDKVKLYLKYHRHHKCIDDKNVREKFSCKRYQDEAKAKRCARIPFIRPILRSLLKLENVKSNYISRKGERKKIKPKMRSAEGGKEKKGKGARTEAARRRDKKEKATFNRVASFPWR